MCVEAGVRGPLTTDAWFAALAIEHGRTWMTFDRDYARFPGLDWREPPFENGSRSPLIGLVPNSAHSAEKSEPGYSGED